jgi:hypothetical protein
MPSNFVITDVDLGSIVLQDPKYRDELLVATGVHSFLMGTILARREDALTVTASAVTGTGNGTVTLATVVGGVIPIVGAYVLTVVTAVANGGVWKLVDPNGEIVAEDLIMTVGAGATTVFNIGGLQFSITDGGTDFVAGDHATLTVAADGKIIPFLASGGAGAQRPIGVLTYQVDATGAGNIPIRMLCAGEVNATRLIIDADGTGANVTAVVLDQLRRAGIVGTDVKMLSVLDNGG